MSKAAKFNSSKEKFLKFEYVLDLKVFLKLFWKYFDCWSVKKCVLQFCFSYKFFQKIIMCVRFKLIFYPRWALATQSVNGTSKTGKFAKSVKELVNKVNILKKSKSYLDNRKGPYYYKKSWGKFRLVTLLAIISFYLAIFIKTINNFQGIFSNLNFVYTQLEFLPQNAHTD